MTPRAISDVVQREAPLLRTDETIEQATRTLLAGDLPALPVVDPDDGFAGIYGEREFMTAVFPGYLKQLRYAGFVTQSLDDALERNETCRGEAVSKHMNTEHVDVGPDFADLQIAETFLHHRVLVVPVVDHGTVCGVITRSDFFRAVAGRFLG
ncbi:MAG TPA: CBS domain-containing protein [Thermoleophilaceae bacterium]|nr:CBS domain-containing protein [Thermoleophilaceae bacterium]